MLKTIANWLIARAVHTPYFHLYHADGTLYMERFWLVPFASPKEGCWVATWREPFTWLCQKLGISIRLHWIHTADLDRALHDHPWTFFSWLLIGWYTEERPTTPEKIQFDEKGVEAIKTTRRTPGSFALRRFHHRHRISAVSPGGVLTLFVSFTKRQSWGFYTPQGKTWWWVFKSVHNNKPITAKAP